ncbi:hypothetical protein BO70DRAFT_102718 [Aspergillus heteromorphus CBS 117.55]|uniref:C2H2-type domain-containing protein n=1 Tax=Aspergillus heteromorphus CBS 117.55 TaxID=1448321 RepID=A0A317VT82_9EURO|nr:uncharacterized protein BO70DRAFT_102718 [Aspergillus heteromorphus CBS 117.55]PWY75140.1 hypothetical protein BO70DRAFT_102718 [Aspergillus heteromorphus CBS 117.55]
MDRSKRFKCQQCSKSYTKLEHLTRHERTHSNTRPFRCDDCGRSFGRADVLGRHKRLHERSQTTAVSDTPQPAEAVTESHLPSPSQPAQGLLGPTPFEQSSLPENQELLDTDNLMDWFMPDFWAPSAFPLLLTELPNPPQLQVSNGPNILSSEDNGASQQEPGKIARQQSYRLIEDLSKRLNSELHDSGITSTFLNACLQEFFERLSPCFPVIHEPSFSSRETIPPLLLNMVALGSLFVCLPDSISKGEMLWRLGHTAVATSWQTLISLRGPRDACDGVQLVLTALLGQLFALLSSNESIRTTAFVWRGLGFYWARTSGMYAVEDMKADQIPGREAPDSTKHLAWLKWATAEAQRRAILSHYILDGLISQASGSPASARHLINSIKTAYSDAAFLAKTADDWIVEMEKSTAAQIPISEVFVSVFSPTYATSPLSLSGFSTFIIIEGLQSLISDLHETSGQVFGAVSETQIIRALLNIYETDLSRRPAVHHDGFQLMLRWHTVCLELAVPSASLCRRICHAYGLPKHLGGMATKEDGLPFDLSRWASSANAMRAVLHALAINRIVNQIPFRQAHAPHIPAAIFASAVVMGGWCLAREDELHVREDIPWQEIWATRSSDSGPNIEQYIHETATGIRAHLLNEMNFLQISLKTITSRWSVSQQMAETIQQFANLARQYH